MEFKYISITFNKIEEQIDKLEKTILISGKECSGKSYILKKLEESYKGTRVILSLGATSALHNLEYGVFLTSLSKIGEYRHQALSVATKFISEKSKIAGLASELLTNYKRNQLKYQLFSFPEIEIEILNRIFGLSKKNKLLILADDVDKWDSESRKLLEKIIILQKDVNCYLPSDTIMLLTVNDTDDLDSELTQCPHVQIQCDLSYHSFVQEAEILGIIDEHMIHELYDITKGNIGLISNIREYIDLASLTGTESLHKQLFQILERRISVKMTEEALHTLQTATVIGKEFNLLYLHRLLEQSMGTLDSYMKIGCDEKLITREDDENLFLFSADTIYNFFVSKLNGRSKDYHYKFAKILEKISPNQFYQRYFHMNMSGNISEAIPLLTVHCIRQCVDGCNPDDKLLETLQKYDNYWNVYQNISYSMNNYRTGTEYKKYYALIESSDVCVDPVVTIERDYVLCFLKYRTGDIYDFHDIEPILIEYFNEDIDLSQHIRIGILLFLLYCNRLGDYEKAKKIEKTITKQIQQALGNKADLEKELRILERLSPALYASEVAYIKTQRSLNYFEHKRMSYGKEYLMSLTNFLGVSIYVVGTTADSSLSWENLYMKACEGIEFLDNAFNMNIYGIPKLINNYILVGIFSGNLTLQNGVALYDSLLAEPGHLPSKPLLECNRMILLFFSEIDVLEPMRILFQSNRSHEYYRFIIGINYLHMLIVNGLYKEAEVIFDELNYSIPTISMVDELYIKNHYNLLKTIIEEKEQYSSVEEYRFFYENAICQKEMPYPNAWEKACIFSDMQYWSEY